MKVDNDLFHALKFALPISLTMWALFMWLLLAIFD